MGFDHPLRGMLQYELVALIANHGIIVAEHNQIEVIRAGVLDVQRIERAFFGVGNKFLGEFLDETLDSPEFVQTPVFRYSDAQRGFLDATMWVWTSGGRPVAFHKVEAMVVLETQASLWGRCFASVSSERLSVEWRDGRHFETGQAGMSFARLPGSPDPGQIVEAP